MTTPAPITDTDRLEFLRDEGYIVNYRPHVGPQSDGLKTGYWLEQPDTGEIQQEAYPEFRDAIDAMMRKPKQW